MPARAPDSDPTIRPGDTRSVVSPDGRIKIDYTMTEGRHSHWIETPSVTDLKTGKKIFSLSSTTWDAGEEWLEAGRFTLLIRRYPNHFTLPVQFDVEAAKVRLGDDPTQFPISSAKKRIERHFRAMRSKESAPITPSYDQPVSAGIRWIQGLSLLIAAGILIYLLL